MDSPLLQRLNILHTLFTEFFLKLYSKCFVHRSNFFTHFSFFVIFAIISVLVNFFSNWWNFWLKNELIQTNFLMGKGFLFPKTFETGLKIRSFQTFHKCFFESNYNLCKFVTIQTPPHHFDLHCLNLLACGWAVFDCFAYLWNFSRR